MALLLCFVVLPSAAGAIAPQLERGAAGANPAMRIELPAHPPAFVESRPGHGAEALQSTAGGSWQIGWHPWVDVARRGVGGRPRTPLRLHEADVRAAAERFRRQHERLLGAAGVTLRDTRWRHAGRAWHATWQQWHEGRRVLGSILDLTLLEDGSVVAFSSTLVPQLRVRPGSPDVTAATRACAAVIQREVELVSSEPVLVVDPNASSFVAVEALELRLSVPTGERWRAVVGSSDSELLQLESTLRTAELTGTARGRVRPYYPNDPHEDVPLRWLGIQLGFAATDPHTFADRFGSFEFVYPDGQVTLRSALIGRFASVDNATSDASPSFQTEVTVPGDVDVHFTHLQARHDELTIYYHVNLIHDFMADRFDFSLLDFPLPAIASAVNPRTGNPRYSNAYWDGERMGFGDGGHTFWNMGEHGDVVYHEYTHAVTDFMYRPAGDLLGAMGGAIHEALSDYFSSTIEGDSRQGENLGRRSSAPLRNLDNSLYWPDDRHQYDEVHANGEILAGALWDVRVAVGADVADRVIHFARNLFPRTFEQYLDAMLLQDDLLFGDGWFPNGSPHREAIMTAFAMHGFGPLLDDVLEIVHAPLSDTEDALGPRRVRAAVRALLKETNPAVRLSYRLAGTEEFEHVWMSEDGEGAFVAEIPGFGDGADVEYYLAAGQYEPTVRIGRLPVDAPQKTFGYHIGPDASPPRVTLAARPTVASFAWPPQLSVHIEDNVGIAYAFVEYRLNGEPGAMLGMVRTAHDPTEYRTRFPHVGGAPGDVLEYWITAVDASQAAHVTRFPIAGHVQMSVVTDLRETFEHDQALWQHAPTVTLRPDAWRLTQSWNHTAGGRRAWLCGSESGDYPSGVAAALHTDWYRVDAGALARVWSWMQARESAPGSAMDGGRVEIQSASASEWTVLEPRGGYTHTVSSEATTNALRPSTPALSGHDGDWRLLEFDLDAWTGERVRLRFLYGSVDAPTATPDGRGWLLDDFEVIAGQVDPTDAPVPPLPEVLRVDAAPNPFNPQVRLRMDIPLRAGHVRLDIHDARGRLLRRLVDGVPRAGSLEVVWDGTDDAGLASASGVYYYRLHTELGLATGRLVLVR